MTVVGVVGVGQLGGPVARRLLSAGHEVQVYDVRDHAVAEITGAGATAVTNPSALVDQCAVVCVVVGDRAQVREAVLGADGLAAGQPSDLAVLVLSTIGPDAVVELARAAAPRGVQVVDAPVSGGPDAALAGSLTVMLGGDPDVLRRCAPVVRALGGEPRRLGGIGAGQAVKLANQVVTFATQAALLEGLALTGAYGVPDDVVRDVLSDSLADSWCVRHWGFFDEVAAAYDASGLPAEDRPWSKDPRTAVQAAGGKDLTVPVTEAVARHAGAAIDAHARRSGREVPPPPG